MFTIKINVNGHEKDKGRNIILIRKSRKRNPPGFHVFADAGWGGGSGNGSGTDSDGCDGRGVS